MANFNFKNFFFAVFVTALVGLLTVSCDGSDDNNSDGGVAKTGVYKVEVQLSGDLDSLYPTFSCGGTSESGKFISIFDEMGNEHVSSFTRTYYEEPFSSVTVYTSSDCNTFIANVTMTNSEKQDCEITVSCKGYFNGKPVKTGEKTITFTKDDLSSALSFDFTDGLTVMY